MVLVVWEDALAVDDATWVENKDHHYKPHIFHQVGFILSATDEGVILTSAWHPELIAGRDQIPRAMIQSITPLEPAKPPRKRK